VRVGHAGSRPGLLTSNALVVRVGLVRRLPVLDGSSLARVGTAGCNLRWRRDEFSLRNCDGTDVIRVARTRSSFSNGWDVFGSGQEPILHIEPARRETRKGKSVLSNDVDGPFVWTGWIFAGQERLAYIRDGLVVSAASGTEIARLKFGRGHWWRLPLITPRIWTLNVADGADTRLRSAALAWLGVAHALQFAVDMSE
jgi:hypothetical protein